MGSLGCDNYSKKVLYLIVLLVVAENTFHAGSDIGASPDLYREHAEVLIHPAAAPGSFS